MLVYGYVAIFFPIILVAEPLPPHLVFFGLVQDFALSLGALFLLIYALRIKWHHPPRIIWYSVLIWTIFWLSFVKLPFFTFYNTVTRHLPEPVVIVIAVLFNLNIVVALVAVMIAYATTEQVMLDKRVNTAKKLWILALGFMAINPAILIGTFLSWWPYIFNQTPTGFLLLMSNVGIITNYLGTIIIGYTTIRYPEAVIFTQAHIIRAINVYKAVTSLVPGEQVKEYGMESLVRYLQSIPPELLAE